MKPTALIDTTIASPEQPRPLKPSPLTRAAVAVLRHQAVAAPAWWVAPSRADVVGLLVVAAALGGCGKAPSAPAAASAPVAATPPVAAAPATAAEGTGASAAPKLAAPATTTDNAAAAEVASYAARRKRVRPVIGGCEESCETPERMLNALISGLSLQGEDERLEALSVLFDWSQLVADGQVLGEPWAEMWDDVRNHPRRDAEIRAWLKSWSSWAQRLAPGARLDAMRGAQTRVEAVLGHADLMVVRLRHPALRDDTTEPEWRLLLARRGWEWLVAEIDHQPSKRPLRLEHFGGSEQAGHL